MSTAFEPLHLASTMRPLSADAPSMADSLPSINLGFDELRDRMAKFTVKFDSFIEQGRKRVLEERNQFRMNVTELKGTYAISSTLFVLTDCRGSTNEEERH
jgi:kinetochore protein Spc25